MELSGCDAVIVLPDFDLSRLTNALRFGLRFNGSATCIGPRRLMVRRSERDSILTRLKLELADEPPIIVHQSARKIVADRISAAIADGAIDLLNRYSEERLRHTGQLHPIVLDQITEGHQIASADIFAPVLSVLTVDDIDHAVRLVNECPYRLAASIFGPASDAKPLANRLNVGTVTINDLIAPTADPRVPFGGRGQSGFGVTRGREGLISMTAAKVVSTRRGPLAPHLLPRTDSDEERLHGALQILHSSGLRKKLTGLRRMVRGVK